MQGALMVRVIQQTSTKEFSQLLAVWSIGDAGQAVSQLTTRTREEMTLILLPSPP